MKAYSQALFQDVFISKGSLSLLHIILDGEKPGDAKSHPESPSLGFTPPSTRRNRPGCREATHGSPRPALPGAGWHPEAFHPHDVFLTEHFPPSPPLIRSTLRGMLCAP